MGGRDALERILSENSPSARARAHFLRVYHGLAKPAVRALLTHLGRDHEYRQFFLDLQSGVISSANRALALEMTAAA